MQREVLRFATFLNELVPRGEPGGDLKHFAASLDSQSAHEMLRAIEEEWNVSTPPSGRFLLDTNVVIAMMEGEEPVPY